MIGRDGQCSYIIKKGIIKKGIIKKGSLDSCSFYFISQINLIKEHFFNYRRTAFFIYKGALTRAKLLLLRSSRSLARGL